LISYYVQERQLLASNGFLSQQAGREISAFREDYRKATMCLIYEISGGE
jgi:hypothetical protein